MSESRQVKVGDFVRFIDRKGVKLEGIWRVDSLINRHPHDLTGLPPAPPKAMIDHRYKLTIEFATP